MAPPNWFLPFIAKRVGDTVVFVSHIALIAWAVLFTEKFPVAVLKSAIKFKEMPLSISPEGIVVPVTVVVHIVLAGIPVVAFTV